MLDGKLYVVGGCDVSRCLSTVEMYDPALNKWAPSENMNVPRACCGVAGLFYPHS